MKEIILEVTLDKTDYLQRLGMDIDNRMFIIDRLFTNHKNDKDSSLFESVPFVTYSKQLEKLNAEYEIAKKEFGEKIVRPKLNEILGDEISTDFEWNINDFSEGKIYVTLL